MTLGNIVSSTGSGLGCPDWPLCHGRVIPPGGAEIWIEFRHRLAVPLFSVLLVATAFLTWRRAATPALRRLAVALVGLLVAQIVLGGVTVLLGLSPLVSTVHLLTALTVLAGLITICAVPDASGVTPSQGSRASRRRGSRCCWSSWRWADTSATRARASPVPISRCAAATCFRATGWAGRTGCTAGSACCCWASSSTSPAPAGAERSRASAPW